MRPRERIDCRERCVRSLLDHILRELDYCYYGVWERELIQRSFHSSFVVVALIGWCSGDQKLSLALAKFNGEECVGA